MKNNREAFSKAIDELADEIEDGHLLAAMNMLGFIEVVTQTIRDLKSRDQNTKQDGD